VNKLPRAFVDKLLRAFDKVGKILEEGVGGQHKAAVRAFVHAVVRAFVHAAVRARVHAAVRARVHAAVRACVHAAVRAFVHAVVRAFVCYAMQIFLHQEVMRAMEGMVVADKTALGIVCSWVDKEISSGICGVSVTWVIHDSEIAS
jgi:hypothetical protein